MNTPPFDVSYHFDEQLHEVPNNPSDMKKAIEWLKQRLGEEKAWQERLSLLGAIGSFSRILREFSQAEGALLSAITVAEENNNPKGILVNKIRLAHVYQWRSAFEKSNKIFKGLLEQAAKEAGVAEYLDFIYQHAGKNLFDQKDYEHAILFFEKALNIRKNKGDAELIRSTEQAIQVGMQKLASGE
jgi:tetratricopeptide (TPR) repeat protein